MTLTGSAAKASASGSGGCGPRRGVVALRPSHPDPLAQRGWGATRRGRSVRFELRSNSRLNGRTGMLRTIRHSETQRSNPLVRSPLPRSPKRGCTREWGSRLPEPLRPCWGIGLGGGFAFVPRAVAWEAASAGAGPPDAGAREAHRAVPGVAKEAETHPLPSLRVGGRARRRLRETMRAPAPERPGAPGEPSRWGRG
jgi:hypothetical protein